MFSRIDEGLGIQSVVNSKRRLDNKAKTEGHRVFRRKALHFAIVLLATVSIGLPLSSRSGTQSAAPVQGGNGREIFRFDTFGDEQLWTDTLRLHEVIQSSVSPVTALGVGLKVD